MEYQVLTRDAPEYPRRLIERLGDKAPTQLCYHGALDLLKRFTMAVICADSITGPGLNETNQLLFTVREYDLNYIGGWHSVMETEIFRLGLFRKNQTVTMFTAKGMAHETFDSFLRDRFFPPFQDFPERDEYNRRAAAGGLLVLSLVDPTTTRTVPRNVVERNWVACALSDVVFVPYGPKGSKTYSMAQRVKKAGWPVFTLEDELSCDLHELGIPGFNRKSVGEYLSDLGARIGGSQRSAGGAVPVQELTARPPHKRIIQTGIHFVSDKPRTQLKKEK
jgi:hypothetical protein